MTEPHWRDGQPYFEVNRLDTSDSRPFVEVRFADDVWLLADPTQDLEELR